ncbi:MAG: UDP-glucose 4-epimerase GalE [Chitinophagaceae bacterium]|jgi:UDP-glucose 4-epimerase|nr:UDP-glucose 4-epimerase GalE [Chitinophagaceae bacterium]
MIPGKILVTGGCGYIGGHTIVDLVNNGFEVISVDDLSNGSLKMLEGVERILGQSIKNYKVDLTNLDDTQAIFIENPDIIGVIHFAAFKSVNESVQLPLKYYRNNLNSLINILQCAKDYQVANVVFSSSCSVYGNAQKLPVDELTPLAVAESPYAFTKQIGEVICNDFVKQNPSISISLLRYFNPVGAHPTSIIGELQDKPENLVPVITQTAIGKRPEMTVFGADYDTRDGSCVRDYIHVMDIANAHTKSLQYLIGDHNKEACEVFNLGSGNGVTVLELIAAFESISGRKLNYKIGPRRDGDVIAVYADNRKAQKHLAWQTKYDLIAMMETAWNWELKLQNDTQKELN